MKVYTKVYMDAFDYALDEWIGCEVCGLRRASEIHHIFSRKRRPELIKEIVNLMAICRECHMEYGEKTYLIPMLLRKHRAKLEEAGIVFDPSWFEDEIKNII